MRGTSPNGGHPWLHAKPLDATIWQVPAPYCPGNRHGRQFRMKQKNTNKTHFFPSFLTVDRRKKAKQFQDPTWTLYSRHQCNKLRTNVKHFYSSWRAQLRFELSNVVNGQKFEKLLTLNKAPQNLWAKYGPIAVKLLKKINKSRSWTSRVWWTCNQDGSTGIQKKKGNKPWESFLWHIFS